MADEKVRHVSWTPRAVVGGCAMPVRVYVPGGSLPDSVAPVLTIISPPGGAEIGANDIVKLSVTDVSGLRRVALLVRFIGASTYEVVFDGTVFGPQYEQASRQLVITNGFEFWAKRRGGWPLGNVQWKVLAFDTAGNEA